MSRCGLCASAAPANRKTIKAAAALVTRNRIWLTPVAARSDVIRVDELARLEEKDDLAVRIVQARPYHLVHERIAERPALVIGQHHDIVVGRRFHEPQVLRAFAFAERFADEPTAASRRVASLPNLKRIARQRVQDRGVELAVGLLRRRKGHERADIVIVRRDLSGRHERPGRTRRARAAHQHYHCKEDQFAARRAAEQRWHGYLPSGVTTTKLRGLEVRPSKSDTVAMTSIGSPLGCSSLTWKSAM